MSCRLPKATIQDLKKTLTQRGTTLNTLNQRMMQPRLISKLILWSQNWVQIDQRIMIHFLLRKLHSSRQASARKAVWQIVWNNRHRIDLRPASWWASNHPRKWLQPTALLVRVKSRRRKNPKWCIRKFNQSKTPKMPCYNSSTKSEIWWSCCRRELTILRINFLFKVDNRLKSLLYLVTKLAITFWVVVINLRSTPNRLVFRRSRRSTISKPN